MWHIIDMGSREVLYYLKRDTNSMMVTRHGAVVTLWCPLRTKQSEADLDNPFLPVLEYARNILGVLLFVPEPRCISVIGLGGGTIPTALSAACGGAIIDVVEIDAAVAGIAEVFFPFRPSERLRLFIGDGAVFIGESAQKALYDIVIVDAYAGEMLPESISSEAFYTDVASCLRDGGVAAVNLMTGNKAVFKRNLRLIHGAFGHLSLLSCKGSKNTVVFASNKKISKSTLSGNAQLIEPKLPNGLCLSGLIGQFKGIPAIDKVRWRLSKPGQ